MPGLRDVLAATYELAGWLLTTVLRSIAGRSAPVSDRLVTFVLVAVVVLFITGSQRIGARALALFIFPAGVVVLRARDIAKMRRVLRSVAASPELEPPAQRAEAKVLSPTVSSLHGTARALSLALRGDAKLAVLVADHVDPSYLDREAHRCLDAARALAAQEQGDGAEASRLAALALPVRYVELDRRLARIILRAAWGDPKRLDAVRRNWSRPGIEPPLPELAQLISLHQLPSSARGDAVEALASDRVEQLAADARWLGAQRLADDLVALAKRRGPYR